MRIYRSPARHSNQGHQKHATVEHYSSVRNNFPHLTVGKKNLKRGRMLIMARYKELVNIKVCKIMEMLLLNLT